MDRGKRYEPLEVLFLFVISLAVRILAGRNSIASGSVLFDGYDTYYHMRRVLFTLDHFPGTLWFDSYINYPHGLALTWPPLFDQIVAGTALILGQGSRHGAEVVGAAIPPILGAVTVIAIYYIAREAFDRDTALAAGFVAAIAPYHISKTFLGVTDHHALEVLAIVLAVLFLVVALSRPEKGYIYAAASGAALAALAYTWLGATAYTMMLLAFAAVQMTIDLKRGTSSRETALAVLTALGISLALMIPFWSRPWLVPSFLGFSALAVSVAVLYAISSIMARRNMPWVGFPAAMAVITGIVLIAPRIFGDLWIFTSMGSLALSGGDYIFGGGMVGRIAEAEPLFLRTDAIFGGYVFTALGWSLLFSLVGLFGLAACIRRSSSERQRAKTLVGAFAILTIVLAIFQVRFLYISSLATAILMGVLFIIARKEIRARIEKNIHQPLVILTLIVLALPFAGGAFYSVIEGGRPQISGDWNEALTWLSENSETTTMDPAKTPEYSVFCWWDYGNWIVYVSQRPVVANNFQAGAVDSARFYLSESDGAAAQILDSKRSRYVITDSDMLYGKLPALTRWVDEDPTTYFSLRRTGSLIAYTPLKRLYNTTLARLHFFDGQGNGRFRLIYESRTLIGTNPPTSRVKIFEYVPGAQINVRAPEDAKVWGVINMTTNQGRAFQYICMGSRVGDHFEMRLPYSTDGRYETRATSPLSVFASSPTGASYRDVRIRDEDVVLGRTIDISLDGKISIAESENIV